MEKVIRQVKMEPRRVKLQRVAAYARVSSGKEAMLHSLSEQISYYSDHIQSHPGWEYAGVYADADYTGTKDSRPEFQRLLADCRAGKIDRVLTKSLSRFARNTVTLLEIVREMKALGIAIVFEKENIDTSSGDGELMLSILASFAQAESLSVSENCKWRIRKDFAEGKTMNLALLYGYRSVNGKIEIVPEEAEVVRRVFAAYLSGIGTPTIAAMLRREHAPTRMGGDWYDKGVMEIQSPLRCTENAAHCHFRKAETDQREIVGQAVPKEKAGSVRERTEKCGAADLLRRTAFHSDSGADHGIPRQAGVRV